MPGPLDELLGRAAPIDDVPADPVHPRVLVRPVEDTIELALVVWSDPGGAPALHHALRPLVEGAFLSELSRPRASITAPRLRLVSFAEVPQADDAVRAFGLKRRLKTPAWRETIAHVRGEASVVGRSVPDEPVAIFESSFATTPVARTVETALDELLGETCFGTHPGQFFAALTDVLEAGGHGLLTAACESLDALERQLVPPDEGVVRWIPPRCFQALCDAVALVAARDRGLTVAWAESDLDADGTAPPPLIRVDRDAPIHVPLGEELLRWLVMPLQPGEEVPPLSAWLRDRIG